MEKSALVPKVLPVGIACGGEQSREPGREGR